MRLGIIANMDRPDAKEVIRRIVGWADQNKASLFFSDRLSESVDSERSFVAHGKLAETSDVIVSLGGDGTLLASARVVGDSGTPIFGINLGSLGFLTQQTPQVLENALTSILDEKYRIEKRMVAEVLVEDGPDLEFPFALNDAVVDRGSVSRIIHLDL